MKIKWAPTRSEKRILYTQPQPDVLEVNGTDLTSDQATADMSDATVVQFDIPEGLREFILDAHREAGELHVTLLRPYTEAEKWAWETPPFRGATFEDYGTQEDLA